MRTRGHAGFTLIELVVTLTVAVVLAMLAAPTFRDLVDKSRLRGATDAIVNLLNISRANAVKLQRPVTFSMQGTTTWCAGSVSAADPTLGSGVAATVSACDCTLGSTDNTTSSCFVGGNPNITGNTSGQYAVVSSTDFSGATISGPDTKVTYTNGVTFNSKFGALDLGNLPSSPLVTVISPTGRYSTQITLSPLGQVNACSVGSKFVSGYQKC